ncbi:hypothetical protein KBD18_01350 [Patescibacteria group bacterium]|nr:hypothetical protein [Patescibacteria group bacterium]
MDESDAHKNRIFAALSYLWILCLIPLYLRKQSPFAQQHGKQGFVLFVLSLAFWVLGWLLLVGWIFWLLVPIVIGLASIVGLVQAIRGKEWNLPLLGSFAKKLQFS